MDQFVLGARDSFWIKQDNSVKSKLLNHIKFNYNKINNNISTMDHNLHFGSRIRQTKYVGLILGLLLVNLAYLELKIQ